MFNRFGFHVRVYPEILSLFQSKSHSWLLFKSFKTFLLFIINIMVTNIIEFLAIKINPLLMLSKGFLHMGNTLGV